MRMRNRAMRRIICMAIAMLTAGMMVSASADGTLKISSVREALQYIAENHPTDLDIGEVRLSPAELGEIADALPEGGKLHFSTTWRKTAISDTDEVIDLDKSSEKVTVSDLETLIRLVPGVKEIHVTKHPKLSCQEMIPVIEKYPDIMFSWQAGSCRDILKYIEETHPTDLNIGSIKLKPSELDQISDALPEGGRLHFSTFWCGTTISDTDETIDLDGSGVKVTANDLDILIRLVPGVKEIRTKTHRNLSNQEMIPLVEKYPDIRFVWLINLGKHYTLGSDDTAYSTMKGEKTGYKLHSSELEVLRYAKDLKALDLGHHAITSLDFLRGLDLEMLILADNDITDLSPLADLPHLQYAELFMNDITDVTPLAACAELLDLNLCFNHVTDLAPLDSCTNLERLWASFNKEMGEETQQHFRDAHPGCETAFYTSNHSSTSDGWRKHPRYSHYVSCFKTHVWIPFSETAE